MGCGVRAMARSARRRRSRSEPTHSTKKPGHDNRALVGQYSQRFVIEVSYK
jgi:hypothetical protein